MDGLELIKAVQKANSTIASCQNCIHVKNVKNYLENFKRQHKNEDFYQKLSNKLKDKVKELNCDLNY
jgi:hypothetical protein